MVCLQFRVIIQKNICRDASCGIKSLPILHVRLVGYERRRGGIFPHPKHGQRVTDNIPCVGVIYMYIYKCNVHVLILPPHDIEHSVNALMSHLYGPLYVLMIQGFDEVNVF